ncbi:hypothetical protein BX283_0544 [Streptomyces sp. TLI_146]|nr:hypothetical protein BX283_0544 [Streptomyces sp. TLI_146]
MRGRIRGGERVAGRLQPAAPQQSSLVPDLFPPCLGGVGELPVQAQPGGPTLETAYPDRQGIPWPSRTPPQDRVPPLLREPGEGTGRRRQTLLGFAFPAE